jgi:hypothetical protein
MSTTSVCGTKRPRDEDKDDSQEDTPIPKAKRYRRSAIAALTSDDWDDDSQVQFCSSFT